MKERVVTVLLLISTPLVATVIDWHQPGRCRVLLPRKTFQARNPQRQAFPIQHRSAWRLCFLFLAPIARGFWRPACKMVTRINIFRIESYRIEIRDFCYRIIELSNWLECIATCKMVTRSDGRKWWRKFVDSRFRKRPHQRSRKAFQTLRPQNKVYFQQFSTLTLLSLYLSSLSLDLFTSSPADKLLWL